MGETLCNSNGGNPFSSKLMNINCSWVPSHCFSKPRCIRKVIVTVGVCGAGIFLLHKLYKKWTHAKLRKHWEEVGKDVVVLHQFTRGKYCPNLSPFALKVETFLRLSNIQYVVDVAMPFGPKTKCPWITLNGKEIPDSEFIIEHLKDHFNVKLDSKLSAIEEANLEAVKILVEDHLFWCVVAWRYWLDRCESFMKSQVFTKPLSWIFPILMVSRIKTKSMIQGIGKHSEVEIYQICEKDCQTLSTILGTKRFFGGDTPCTADCAIFGGLSQLMWNAPESKYEDLLKEKYKNLAQYCLRMKENAFPDWNDLLVR